MFLTVHAKKVAFMKEVIDVMNYLIAKNRQNSFIIYIYIYIFSGRNKYK